MEKDKDDQWQEILTFSSQSAFGLRGRQSVRATFRLSEACIDAISILAAHLGIKQKSVFDHLMEDTGLLNDVAREMEDRRSGHRNRVQKTFVISRRSLHFLDKISHDFNAPRDALVEYSVQRLLPIIAREREKHEIRKVILGQISRHYKKGKRLLDQVRSELGADDPVYVKLKSAMVTYHSAFTDIGEFVEKGKLIEDFQPDEIFRKPTPKTRMD